jgi:hypothetical protein
MIGIIAVLGAGPARAERSVTDLSAELARMRLEVEDLAARIDERRASMRTREQALAARQTEVELDIQREELRVARVEKLLDERRQKNEAVSERSKRFVPLVAEAAEQLRRVVRAGLPFHVEERLADIDAIVTGVDEGLVLPHDGLARLWDRVEDELRLTRENGAHSQVVSLDGQEVLAEVARLGMVAMFFRTPDGRVGAANQTRDGWRWRVASSQADEQRIAALFDSFRKQIRTGLFEIPTNLPEVTP